LVSTNHQILSKQIGKDIGWEDIKKYYSVDAMDGNSLSDNSRTTLCHNLPAKIEDDGELCLWLPSVDTLDKLLYCLKKLPILFTTNPQELLCQLQLVKQTASELLLLLQEKFSDRELKSTKVLSIAANATPQLQDFPKVTTLRHFITLRNSRWLLDLLSTGSLTNHFQPIVSAQDPSQLFALESLMRGISRQGELISPRQIFGASEDLDLMCQVDLVARQNTIEAMGRWQSNCKMFINFLPTCLEDPSFCLHCTIADIDEAGIPHDRVIFEITEVEKVKDINRFRRLLDLYRETGFQIALDDLGSGYSSLNMLHQLRPDFIKLDIDLIRNVHQDRYKSQIAQKLLEVAQSLNVQTIAEGVESPGELDWARENGANYVQGYLIAKPAPMSANFSLLAKQKFVKHHDRS
jgi:EAL domain-containing protein (putative c-di-GMP-specific phosphodiesterase class I)